MSATPIDALFAAGDTPSLGPERRPTARSKSEIEKQLAAMLADQKITGPRGDCLHALVLLWNDYLDEAHAMVQDLGGSDAAFVHGIMHRREPDYGNARYWFNRVGSHPAYESLAEAAAPILAGQAALPYRLIRDGKWDPFAFIEAVAGTRGSSSSEESLLRELQRQESMTLARYLSGTDRARR